MPTWYFHAECSVCVQVHFSLSDFKLCGASLKDTGEEDIVDVYFVRDYWNRKSIICLVKIRLFRERWMLSPVFSICGYRHNFWNRCMAAMFNIVFQKAWINKTGWNCSPIKVGAELLCCWSLVLGILQCSLSYGPDPLRMEKYYYSTEIP